MAAVGTIGGAAAQEVTLRMHQFLPPQAHVPKNTLIPWAERIQEASGGRIEVQHFPSMQLGGKLLELIDQVIDGVADIVWTVSGYTPGRFPRTEVFELPFMMNDAEATSRFYWQLAEETMMEGDPDRAEYRQAVPRHLHPRHSRRPRLHAHDLALCPPASRCRRNEGRRTHG